MEFASKLLEFGVSLEQYRDSLAQDEFTLYDMLL